MGATATLPNMYLPSSGGGGGQSIPGGGGSQNANPLGTNVFSNLAATSPTVATLPISVPTGVMGPGSTTPGTAGGFNPIAGAGVNTSTSAAGDHTLQGDLQQTYGRGTGTAISNVLGGLGTSTSTAEQLMLQPTMQAAQQMQANLQAGQAARGVSADSSTAALEQSNLAGKVSAGIAGEMGQIGLSEEGTLLNALLGTGTAHGGDTSFMKSFTDVITGQLPLISAVAGGISEHGGQGGQGVGGGLGSLLDIIGSL